MNRRLFVASLAGAAAVAITPLKFIAPKTHEKLSVYFGSFRDVAVWDVVLTDEEIEAYKSGVDPRTIRPDKLRVYWPNITGKLP